MGYMPFINGISRQNNPGGLPPPCNKGGNRFLFPHHLRRQTSSAAKPTPLAASKTMHKPSGKSSPVWGRVTAEVAVGAGLGVTAGAGLAGWPVAGMAPAALA